jgi:hypothetical protein
VKRSADGVRPKAAADIQIFRFRIDRSGSMSSMEKEAYEGTIDYLKTSAELAIKNGSKGHMTLGTFDGEMEMVFENESFKRVFNRITDDLGKQVIKSSLIPRGMTKLRDAVIEDVCALRRQKKELEKKLPKHLTRLNPTIIVTYAVFTDGQDNSSRNSVKMMSDAVKAARDEDIICLFLAANQDACSAGERFGFRSDHSLDMASSGDGAQMGFRSATVATQRAVTTSAFAPPGSCLRQSSAAFTPLERNVSQGTNVRQHRSARSISMHLNNTFVQNSPLPPPSAILRQPAGIPIPTISYRSGRQSPLNPNAPSWNPSQIY